MTKWATVGGERVRLWEDRMHVLAKGTDAATGFRGLRVERDGLGVPRAHIAWAPADVWLGINLDGTRKTIAQYRAERGM